MNNLNSLEISKDTMVLLENIGIMGELISEMIDVISSDCSTKFHRQLVDRKISSSYDDQEEWFETGLPAQMIKPGEVWKKGKFRLRMVAEFVPDEEVENELEQPIEPSLDEFRE